MTEMQRRFVEAYMGRASGNATEAARQAGYSDPNYGRQLLTNPNVQAALAERQENDPAVSDREERQAWWTAVMRGERTGPEGAGHVPDLNQRLKASELLARTGGDFTDRSVGRVEVVFAYERVAYERGATTELAGGGDE